MTTTPPNTPWSSRCSVSTEGLYRGNRRLTSEQGHVSCTSDGHPEGEPSSCHAKVWLLHGCLLRHFVDDGEGDVERRCEGLTGRYMLGGETQIFIYRPVSRTDKLDWTTVELELGSLKATRRLAEPNLNHTDTYMHDVACGCLVRQRSCSYIWKIVQTSGLRQLGPGIYSVPDYVEWPTFWHLFEVIPM